MTKLILLTAVAFAVLAIVILRFTNRKNKNSQESSSLSAQEMLSQKSAKKEELALKTKPQEVSQNIQNSFKIKPESNQQRNLDREVGGLEQEKENSSKAAQGKGVLNSEENTKVLKDEVGENSKDDKEKAKDPWDYQPAKIAEALTSRTFTKEDGKAGSALIGIEVKAIKDRVSEKKEGKSSGKKGHQNHSEVKGPATQSILKARMDRSSAFNETGGIGAGMNGGIGGFNRGGQGGGGRY